MKEAENVAHLKRLIADVGKEEVRHIMIEDF